MKAIVAIIVVLFALVSCQKDNAVLELAIPRVIAIDRTDTFLLKRLDSMYTSAVSIDTTDRVFVSAEGETQLYTRWVEFHNLFASYLTSKDLHFEKSTPAFVTLYCSKSGSIDHAAYAFIEPIDSLKEKRYAQHLEEFIKTNGLGMTASKPYSQCGGVGY
ncbi:MAG: hypothetical protein IPF79_06245 [Ignavibacteria bacterium]|nr:hypothetical protein [Ignavibacteria bacterium]